jgi:hemoglobin
MAARLRALLLAPWLLACGGAAVPSTSPGSAQEVSPAARSSASTAPSTRAVASSPTLLDRIGGRRVLSSVVDELLVDLFADNRINKFFESTRRDPARTKALREALVVFFCVKAGGTDCGSAPTRSLGDAHAGMPIAPAHVDAFLEDVRIALAVNHVDEALRDEVVASMADVKSQIVNETAK